MGITCKYNNYTFQILIVAVVQEVSASVETFVPAPQLQSPDLGLTPGKMSSSYVKVDCCL